jgi:hypothetical protein
MTNRSVEYTYVSLWTGFLHLKDLYERASRTPDEKDSALALRLAALTVAFFALEAFLNHIIRSVRPDVWEKERKHFNSGKPIDGVKYRGPLGKLQFVHVLCAEPYDENSDAVQSFKNLKQLRDFMAHGQTIEEAPPDMPILAYPPDSATPRLFELATDELLTKSNCYVHSLRLSLFGKVAQCFPEKDLGPNPDSGISISQSIRVV